LPPESKKRESKLGSNRVKLVVVFVNLGQLPRENSNAIFYAA
jgi:hypothetical protein